MAPRTDLQPPPRPPDGVLSCGCTTDVIEDLWARAGITKPAGRSLWSTIEAHVAPHLGPFEGALHDGSPGRTWGDVLVHGPSPERPSIDLVTAGMSAKAMKPPGSLRRRGAARRAELVFRLTPDWLDACTATESILRPDRAWTFQWLALVARLPYEVRSYFGDAPGLDPSHRVMPLPSVGGKHPFVAALLADPARFGRPFPQLRSHSRDLRPGGGVTRFLSVVPLFESELECVLHGGAERLFAALAAAGVDDITRCDREPVM